MCNMLFQQKKKIEENFQINSPNSKTRQTSRLWLTSTGGRVGLARTSKLMLTRSQQSRRCLPCSRRVRVGEMFVLNEFQRFQIRNSARWRWLRDGETFLYDWISVIVITEHAGCCEWWSALKEALGTTFLTEFRRLEMFSEVNSF